LAIRATIPKDPFGLIPLARPFWPLFCFLELFWKVRLITIPDILLRLGERVIFKGTLAACFFLFCLFNVPKASKKKLTV